MKITTWTIAGSMGEPIYISSHEPEGSPKGVVLMAHGFKGYKEYGMFPWLADALASCGYRAHRFNFSHSGMTDNDGPFERPELFEQSTWNSQVEDLHTVANECALPDCPLILFGHSRGGVASLLAVGRGVVEASRIITLASPSQANSMSPEIQEKLLKEGKVESPSGRTGQMLYVGKRFLEEQLASPESHNVLSLTSHIRIPVLVIHGSDDETVPIEEGIQIVDALQDGTFVRIVGGNHVFNTANPFPMGETPPKELRLVWESISSWL